MDEDKKIHQDLEAAGLFETHGRFKAVAPEDVTQALDIILQHIWHFPTRDTQWALRGLEGDNNIRECVKGAMSSGDYSLLRERECSIVCSP